MPRIRTIKPEFWDSPGTARASLRARLFYIALWNWADDWGVGDANPKRLLGFAFPNDESSDVEPRNFRRLAEEVAECFDVIWYEAEGREYYAIPSWEEHQRTEKKAKRANPAPQQGFRRLYDSASENPPLDLGNGQEGKGTGEEGNRKKEELLPSLREESSSFDDFYRVYPRKVGREEARKAFERVSRKTAVDVIVAGAARFAADPNLPEKQFIPHPATWLNRGGWDDEPQAPRGEQHQSKDDRALSVLEMGRRLQAEHDRQQGAITA